MKTKMNLILATILTICGGVSMQAQTVRGTVTDAISGEKLIGATVKVVETGIGSVVDLEGNFRIDIPQSGRYTLETSYMGYEPNVVKEVLVAGVKEVVIDIQLRENNTELTEVVVRPRVNKEATVNPSVLTGGVMLSMEEASRFAGGYNDPARLVMSFAGISGEADGSGLSIHGNAPERMQYRIEGVGVFYSEKKNFYITLQLVTRNAASYCGSYRYSGDSFDSTRHPLITQIFVSC